MSNGMLLRPSASCLLSRSLLIEFCQLANALVEGRDYSVLFSTQNCIAIYDFGKPSMQCVYILDDNQDFGQTLTKMVRSLGFDCVAFTMCEDFIEAVREQPPSLYMVDMWLGTTTALKIQKTW